MLFSFVWFYSTCSNPDKRKENSDCWFRIILWEPIWERGCAAFIFRESSRLVLSWTSTEPKLVTKGWIFQFNWWLIVICLYGALFGLNLKEHPVISQSQICFLFKAQFWCWYHGYWWSNARFARILFLKRNCKSKQKTVGMIRLFFYLTHSSAYVPSCQLMRPWKLRS